MSILNLAKTSENGGMIDLKILRGRLVYETLLQGGISISFLSKYTSCSFNRGLKMEQVRSDLLEYINCILGQNNLNFFDIINGESLKDAKSSSEFQEIIIFLNENEMAVKFISLGVYPKYKKGEDYKIKDKVFRGKIFCILALYAVDICLTTGRKEYYVEDSIFEYIEHIKSEDKKRVILNHLAKLNMLPTFKIAQAFVRANQPQKYIYNFGKINCNEKRAKKLLEMDIDYYEEIKNSYKSYPNFGEYHKVGRSRSYMVL